MTNKTSFSWMCSRCGIISHRTLHINELIGGFACDDDSCMYVTYIVFPMIKNILINSQNQKWRDFVSRNKPLFKRKLIENS